ncbi:hypothetical protein ACSLBF_13795 [Pseudoalteromonas sp. T1lg65]|uniref:hypothetical protein n=1 Tax=Pseudoalteromonas sp. T1lg65 TaxID=2077101 RepID=UPI003F7AC260
MKKFNMALSLVAAFVCGGAMALPNQAFDTDGFERVTEYSQGPVATSIITSEFAHHLNVYLHPRANGDSCSYGNIYDHTTGQQIAHANVTRVPAQVFIQQASADIPEEFLTNNKRLVVSCTTAEGEDYDVMVNVPGAPIVNWELKAEPRGEFVYRSQAYSYHSAYEVTSVLNVNNQGNGGSCKTLSNRGVELGLFHGKDGKGNFHSDVFSTNVTVDNSEATQPVIYQILECQNAAGKTMAVKVLTLTNPDEIYLMEDELIIK